MKKELLLSLKIGLILTVHFIGNSQTNCLTIDNEDTINVIKTQLFCNSNSFLSNYKADKRGLNQYDQTPIYTVKLKVHVIQYSEADPRNYTTADIPEILWAIYNVNQLFSNLQPPTIPVLPPSEEDTKSQIQFSLNEEDIDFIQDTIGWAEYTSPKEAIINSFEIINNLQIKINGVAQYSFNYNCIEITGSVNNNGIYRIASRSYSSGNVILTLSDQLNNISDNSGSIYGITNDNTTNRFYSYNKYHKNDNSAIHIYLVRNTSECYTAGFGEAYSLSPYALRMVAPIGSPLNIGYDLLAHELGHCLGLSHTWSSPSVINDIYRPDNNLSWASCNSVGISNNIMGYNTCRNYLSPLQIAYMRKVLTSSPLFMEKVIESQQENNRDVIITENTVWEDREIIGRTLYIESGATLTIRCRVHCSPDAKVIIKPGGRLIIDGGSLTNVFGEFWEGIEVWGTSNQHQFPLSHPTYQGKLELINGGMIEHAKEAAQNWKPNDWNKIGGVIVSNGGVFKNNRRSVAFMIYENFHQTNPSIKRNNLSYFQNTDFITDDNYNTSSTSTAQITLWSVYGINFSNCRFSNEMTNKSYSAGHNKAIYSIDAGYNISATCASTPPFLSPCPPQDLQKSSFKGFNKAIEATGAGTTKTINVSQTNFENNLFGMELSEFDNVSVNYSNFILGNPYPVVNRPAYGIKIDNSTGFIIEENSFSHNSVLLSATYGTTIMESGTESNRLYKNHYKLLTHGQHLVGVNRSASNSLVGLQFLCNQFDGNTNAIHILNSNLSHGVRAYQGEYSPLKSAGNTFVNTPLGGYTINNLTTWPITYYHNNGNTVPTNNTSNVSLYYTSNANACPSLGIGDPGIGGVISFSEQSVQNMLDSLLEIHDNLYYNYLSLIDGGNTAGFIQKINSEWSNGDAWNLRSSLMEKTPYLSQDVLLEAVRHNILPDAMILEICLANPDAVKGEEFIKKLKEACNSSFPDYLLEYIRQNCDTKTARTALEAQIASIISERSVIEHAFINKKLTSEERSYEEILALLLNKSGIQGKIGLLEFAIEQEKWDMADSVLNLALNDINNQEEHYLLNNYKEYILFRRNLKNRKLIQLDESEVSYLEKLAQHEGRVAGYAKNILCFFYNICFEEKLSIQEPISSSSSTSMEEKTLNELFYSLTIYPNPAREQTTLKWEILDVLNNCQYRVYDISGSELMNGIISENRGTRTLDTKKLKNGIYLITIENGGVKKQTLKLVIQDEY